MSFVSYQNIIDIFNGIAPKISGGTGFKDWQANTDYTQNQIIVYEGQMYKVIVDFTSGSTFSTDNLEKYVPQGLSDDEMDAIVAAFNPSGGSSGGGN